jgi:TRAP-type C4-dicarboxylate transport system substrate-binding protein
LLASAATTGTEIKANARRESDDSVKAMEKRGLTVTKVTPEQETLWRLAAEAAYPQIRGSFVPADVFDLAIAAIKEYRSKAGK